MFILFNSLKCICFYFFSSFFFFICVLCTPKSISRNLFWIRVCFCRWVENVFLFCWRLDGLGEYKIFYIVELCYFSNIFLRLLELRYNLSFPIETTYTNTIPNTKAISNFPIKLEFGWEFERTQDRIE